MEVLRIYLFIGCIFYMLYVINSKTTEVGIKEWALNVLIAIILWPYVTYRVIRELRR